MNRTSSSTSRTVNTSAMTRVAVHIGVFVAEPLETLTFEEAGVPVFVGGVVVMARSCATRPAGHDRTVMQFRQAKCGTAVFGLASERRSLSVPGRSTNKQE